MNVPIEHPEALSHFTEGSDRGDADVFVGRAAELDWLDRRLRHLATKGHVAGADHTVLFEGCPGMGKSALLYEFARRARRSGSPSVDVDLDALTSHGAMRARITRQLNDMSAAHGRVGDIARAVVVDVGKALLIGHTAKAAMAKDAGRLPKDRSRIPLVLLIDEAQDLGEEHRAAVRSLHLSNLGWPILPLFAGTHGAGAALGRAGAYRRSIGRDRRLEPLSEDDARLAFPALCERFGIGMAVGQVEQWANRIAVDSGGFPQHLNVGLTAAAEELLEANERGRAPDLERAAEASADGRDDYYRGRLGNVLPEYGDVLAAVVQRMRRSSRQRLRKREALDTFFSAANKAHTPGGFPPPTANGVRALVDRAIQNGVFQPAGEGTLELSIPSMGDYIERTCGEREDLGRQPPGGH